MTTNLQSRDFDCICASRSIHIVHPRSHSCLMAGARHTREPKHHISLGRAVSMRAVTRSMRLYVQAFALLVVLLGFADRAWALAARRFEICTFQWPGTLD